jgi:hypothetical protein
MSTDQAVLPDRGASGANSREDSGQVQVSVDEFLVEKLGNLVKFLNGTEAIKARPSLTAHLKEFANKEDIGYFKKYFADKVAPHLDNLNTVLDRMLSDYELLRKDFKDEEIERFKLYLECFGEAMGVQTGEEVQEPPLKKQKAVE